MKSLRVEVLSVYGGQARILIGYFDGKHLCIQKSPIYDIGSEGLQNWILLMKWWFSDAAGDTTRLPSPQDIKDSRNLAVNPADKVQQIVEFIGHEVKVRKLLRRGAGGGVSRGALQADLHVRWGFDKCTKAMDTCRLNFMAAVGETTFLRHTAGWKSKSDLPQIIARRW
ncbi:hypothetical protein CIHG_07120 [Coccidioides immitis H538.4]|uniref:Uncharacterized protein n=1 Tax=Coccidioides immitis H538.4 TaxID=396776 RepID=A0A0J8RX83_COCIT|nr:hypothetical protein CIHG_07120 [Coccidioides immitis H538.4]